MRFAGLDWLQQQTGAVESAPENRLAHYSNGYPLERGVRPPLIFDFERKTFHCKTHWTYLIFSSLILCKGSFESFGNPGFT
jgi:hypothetical protein